MAASPPAAVSSRLTERRRCIRPGRHAPPRLDASGAGWNWSPSRLEPARARGAAGGLELPVCVLAERSVGRGARALAARRCFGDWHADLVAGSCTALALRRRCAGCCQTSPVLRRCFHRPFVWSEPCVLSVLCLCRVMAVPVGRVACGWLVPGRSPCVCAALCRDHAGMVRWARSAACSADRLQARPAAWVGLLTLWRAPVKHAGDPVRALCMHPSGCFACCVARPLEPLWLLSRYVG